MRFWMNRDVDGFRPDVVKRFIKDDLLRDNPTHLRPARTYDRQETCKTNGVNIKLLLIARRFGDISERRRRWRRR